MRIHEIKLYKFDELSEESKQKAVERLSDINVIAEWWEGVYLDAEMIGLKITSFDTYRKDITGHITDDLEHVIKAIEINHWNGDSTALADEYKLKLAEIHETVLDDDMPDAVDELASEFENELLEIYLSALISEYNYLTTDKAIIETIEANEYEFTKDGNPYF